MLPNLLVDGIRQAIQASPALKVYVCNVATQHGETDAFTVGDHFGALERHVGSDLFHYVLANSNIAAGCRRQALGAGAGGQDVSLGGTRVISADVVSEDNRYHHDPKKLADALIRLYYERHQLEEMVAEAAPEGCDRVGL